MFVYNGEEVHKDHLDDLRAIKGIMELFLVQIGDGTNMFSILLFPFVLVLDPWETLPLEDFPYDIGGLHQIIHLLFLLVFDINKAFFESIMILNDFLLVVFWLYLYLL